MHEATAFAGGRCRSYHDAALGMMIDNGNHLLLSGNHAALDYLRTIGAQQRLAGPPAAEFSFVDLASRQRWTLRFNHGRLPLWIFDRGRRVPGTRALDYVPLARLLWARPGKALGEVIACEGPLYRRLLEPLFLAALNIDPPQGSARLATARDPRNACRRRAGLPAADRARGLGRDAHRARAGVSATARRRGAPGASIARHCALRAERVEALDFGKETIVLTADDAVILAVPPYAAAVAGARPRRADRVPRHRQRAFPHRAAGRRSRRSSACSTARCNGFFPFPAGCRSPSAPATGSSIPPREELAKTIWGEVARVTGLPAALPAWQIVRERRATFAATPAQDAKRPGAETQWRNLVLAGDWTNTGLPATIEGAIRSGNRAADLIARRPTANRR